MKKKIVITLAAAAVTLTAVSISGCGGSGSSESGNKEDNKLYVYNWGEYIDEDVISMFEEETGIQVVYDLNFFV